MSIIYLIGLIFLMVFGNYLVDFFWHKRNGKKRREELEDYKINRAKYPKSISYETDSEVHNGDW